jgi:hypothetical protein
MPMPEINALPTTNLATNDSPNDATSAPIPETRNEQPETALTPGRRQRALARQGAARALRCCHIKTNGLPCHSPALRSNVLCYFHDKWLHNAADDLLPPLEDGNGVQFALMYVVGMLRKEIFRDGQANIPAVKQMLYALQTASHNLRYVNFDPRLKKSTTDPFANDDAADDDYDHEQPRKPAASVPSEENGTR